MKDKPKARRTIQIDNENVLVREWCFDPGDESGWHRHAYDFVVVPRTDGRLGLVTHAGESFVDLVAGQSYMRKAGTEHNVTNVCDHEVVIMDIELKSTGEDKTKESTCKTVM